MATLVFDAPASADRIPPLTNGDWLRREEFHRRYLTMPEVNKAELIQNIVYMASPVRHAQHGSPHARLLTWLGSYAAGKPSLDLGANATVILDDDNEPQPDALLRVREEHGGQSRVGEDGYIHGAPEFVAEIAASTTAYDLHQKKEVYLAHGVREYLVWSVEDQRLDWWELREGQYVTVPLDADGLARSRVFPGLWLDARALLGGDLAGVLAGVGTGLAAS